MGLEQLKPERPIEIGPGREKLEKLGLMRPLQKTEPRPIQVGLLSSRGGHRRVGIARGRGSKLPRVKAQACLRTPKARPLNVARYPYAD